MSALTHMVYRLYSADQRIIYIGITNSWARRRLNHARVQPWWGEVARVELESFPSREDAASRERTLIAFHRPDYNIDDKPLLPDEAFCSQYDDRGRDVLTITEAADELGIRADSLRQAVLRGAVKAMRAGGIWLLSREEVEKYRRERKPNRGRPRTPKQEPTP